MEPALKTRLIGAAVLIALAVIIVPMFFSGQTPRDNGGKSVSLAIPSSTDATLTTRTMSVAPPAQGVPAAAGSAARDTNHLATVDIASQVPRDVHPERDTQPTDTGRPAPRPRTKPETSSTPDQATSDTTADTRKQATDKAKAKPDKPAPGQAANGKYRVSLGAYGDSNNARDLVNRVRKLGYGVATDKVMISGKPAARISAGPFSSRAAAEAARLRLKKAIPSAPATLMSSASDQQGDAPARTQTDKRAGGWAVQIGAYSKQADAKALVSKLRKAGFDGYTDDVNSGGRTLWRVRVGPQTQRADAQKVRDDVKSRLKLPGVVVAAH